MKSILLISGTAVFLLFSFTPPGKQVTTLKGMKKLMQRGYAYVPGGQTVMDGDTVNCEGFFMMKGEVTNFDYKEYLYSLKSSGKQQEYLAALPDTTGWNMNGGINSPFVEYYFSHPAYRDYPVVNISREQAEKYCVWLSEVWRKNTGNDQLEFRLPKRSEFLRAANGTALKRPYSWDGPFLRTEDGRHRANCAMNGAEGITRDTVTGELKVVYPKEFFEVSGQSNDLVAPSVSFWANEFGLYNLNGNVAEMISDGNWAAGGSWISPGFDVRNESLVLFSKSTPTVGFRPVMTFVEKSE